MDVCREDSISSQKLKVAGEIASGIAQEINDPLTAISAYSQLLSGRLAEPQDRECARRISDGVGRIRRLVRSLMGFTQCLGDGFFPLDLNGVVRRVVSFQAYELAAGDTTLSNDLDESLPRVFGAVDQLEQLFSSLLANARDAVGGRGVIKVKTFAAGDRVVAQVEDDGVGIGPEEMGKIFDPFFTTKPAGKGTGLGLFVAAGIARLHRGEISVASEPGRGSRFTLSLPAFGVEGIHER